MNKLDKKVVTYNLALGEKSGSIKFSSNRADDMNRVTNRKEDIDIKQIKLDDVTKDIPKINLLKVDVEGYEKFVCLQQ